MPATVISTTQCGHEMTLRSWMTRIKTVTIARTNKMWMNPPKVYEVTRPSSHKTSKTAKIVQSTLTPIPFYSLVRG
jgi:hypothetical protein